MSVEHQVMMGSLQTWRAMLAAACDLRIWDLKLQCVPFPWSKLKHYGLLLVCFHSNPPLSEEMLPPGEWMCHRCTVRRKVKIHLFLPQPPPPREPGCFGARSSFSIPFLPRLLSRLTSGQQCCYWFTLEQRL